MESEVLTLPGSRVSIESATWRDLNQLRQLEKVCFPRDAWPLLDLIGVLTLPNVVRLKAMADERMVGFIAGEVRKAEKTAWIATVGVIPEYRRQGIGRSLLRLCEGSLEGERICLNVRVSNTAAVKMYESFGYARAGLWSRYYEDGEDALVMEKAHR